MVTSLLPWHCCLFCMKFIDSYMYSISDVTPNSINDFKLRVKSDSQAGSSSITCTLRVIYIHVHDVAFQKLSFSVVFLATFPQAYKGRSHGAVLSCWGSTYSFAYLNGDMPLNSSQQSSHLWTFLHLKWLIWVASFRSAADWLIAFFSDFETEPIPFCRLCTSHLLNLLRVSFNLYLSTLSDQYVCWLEMKHTGVAVGSRLIESFIVHP